MYLFLVDDSGAFDSIKKNKPWKIFGSYGCAEITDRDDKKHIENNTRNLKFDDECSGHFHGEAGLSPVATDF